MPRKKNETPSKSQLNPANARKEFLKCLVIDLFLKGYTYDIIREKVIAASGTSITRPTIAKYIDECLTDWRTNRSKKVEDIKLAELEKINLIENEAWKAWEYSCRPMITKKQTEIPGGDNPIVPRGTKLPKSRGRPTKLSGTKNMLLKGEMTETKQRVGDVRFLQVVEWCIEKRIEILGVAMDLPAAKLQSGNVPEQPKEEEVVEKAAQRIITFNVAK